MCSILLDLLAESEDIIVDGTGIRCFIEAPDVGQELIARNDFPLVLEKILQELEFPGVGVNSFPTLEKFVSDEVGADVSKRSACGFVFRVGLLDKSRPNKDLEDVNFAFGKRRGGIFP